jgi:adenylate kinase family enzyme
MAKVILVCGVPGVGKSTLAEEIAKSLDLPLFSKDKLEASLVENGLVRTEQLNGVGYTLLKNLVNEHLSRQQSIIIDLIADKNRVLDLWPELLTKDLVAIECICTDKLVHKSRIESRQRNITGWYELNWTEIEDISAKYSPLVSDRLILDTTNGDSSILTRALKYVSN